MKRSGIERQWVLVQNWTPTASFIPAWGETPGKWGEDRFVSAKGAFSLAECAQATQAVGPQDTLRMSSPRAAALGWYERRLWRQGGTERAFTLIELVISAALMSLVLVSAYLCLQAAVSSQKLIEPRLEVFQTARVAMALITADLRCACPLSQDYEFLGTHRMSGDVEADSLDFATHNYTPRRSGEGDFCAVSVFLDKNPRTGRLSLWRRRNPHITLDPLSGGSREEIAKGVRGLRFEYSDGYDWYESWGDTDLRGKQQFSQRVQANLSGLPEAVRITLWLDSNPRTRPNEDQGSTTNEPPLVFQTVARLTLADSGKTAPSAGSSTNAAPDTSTQNQTSGQVPGGVQ